MDDNISIVDAKLLDEVLIPSQPINIEVTLVNNGNHNVEDRIVQLIIDDVIVGQQLVTIQSNKNKSFLFKTTLKSNGAHIASIKLEDDNRISDNRYYFIINSPEKQNIGIYSNKKIETYYIIESLKALNTKGEVFNIQLLDNYSTNKQNLSDYETLFIDT